MLLSRMPMTANIYDAIACFGCVVCAFAASKLIVALFNALPAKWLCDYNEQPGAELYGKRLFFRPHGIVITLVLTAAFIGLFYQYGYSFYFFACSFAAVILLLISFADYRYSIIPDQFTLVLLLTATAVTGYDLLSKQHLFSPDWLSPLYGAAAGAGLMLALGLFGKLLYKKEAIGFGDVKLFGAIGILTGFPQILIVFLLTIFLAFFHIIYLLLRKRISKEVYLPLGPYLCLGLLLFLAFNRQINGFCSWYMSLLSF